MLGQGLSQDRDLRLHLASVNPFGLHRFPRQARDFGRVPLDNVHPNRIEEFQALHIAQAGGPRAAHIEDHRNDPPVGRVGGILHRLDEVHRERADVEHQGGGEVGHVFHFLAGVGHNRGGAQRLYDLRTVVNRHPIGQMMHHRRLPADSFQDVIRGRSHANLGGRSGMSLLKTSK